MTRGGLLLSRTPRTTDDHDPVRQPFDSKQRGGGTSQGREDVRLKPIGDPLSEQDALAWSRSTKCANSSCVEAARHGGTVLIRDSKDPNSPTLSYTPEEWRAFIAGVKAGEFDHLAAELAQQ